MKTTISKLLLCIVFLSFISCEQEESAPVKYGKNRFDEGAIYLYARGGEINDLDKANRFIDNVVSSFAAFNIVPSLDSNFVDYDSANFDLEIVSSSKARFILSNGDVKEYGIIRKNGTILFVKDSVEQTPIYTDYEWLKFKPIIVKTEPYIGGQVTYLKPTIFAYEVDGEIHFPIVSLMLKYDNGINCFFQQREPNSICDDYLSEITLPNGPNDTIIFRESRIIFSKE